MTAVRVIRRILSVQELRVAEAESAWKVLRHFEQGKADFDDYLTGVTNQEEKVPTTYTYDQRAAESEFFRLIPLSSPVPGLVGIREKGRLFKKNELIL